ncbi:MAG: PAS domain-containing protein [Opitutaceae bacterium]
MLPDVLLDKAIHYAVGGMEEEEQDGFEILIEFLPDLQALVEGLRLTVSALAASSGAIAAPAALKERVFASLGKLPPRVVQEGLVATDPGGLIQWVNADFTAMCGYSLTELKGRKPGHVLQGRDTDMAAVARIRAALRAGRGCRESLVNYHKDGSRYRVDVRITAILDDDAKPLWFVARERLLAESTAA